MVKDFIKDLSGQYQVANQPPTYDDREWSMGDLKRLGALTEKVRPGTDALVGIALGQKRQVAELQSALLKGASFSLFLFGVGNG